MENINDNNVTCSFVTLIHIITPLIDYSTPTMTLAVDMQIDALACNAGLREGSLPTYSRRSQSRFEGDTARCAARRPRGRKAVPHTRSTCKSNNKARIASNPCSFTCPVRGPYLPPARSAAHHRARMCR